MLHKIISKIFFILSAVAVLAAMYGWALQDIWLASTQWLQIAIVFLLMAIYVKICEGDDAQVLAARKKKKK